MKNRRKRALFFGAFRGILNGSPRTRRWKIAVFAGTVGFLGALGFGLYGSGTSGTPKPVAASVSAGARAVAGGGSTGATTEDWEGTGLAATTLDPSKFARGACTEFTPEAKGAYRNETVFLDAGHGGIDPGGTGQTQGGSRVTESAVNLKVVMDAMRLLTADGYQVVVSRSGQTTVLRLGPGDTDGGLLSVQGARRDIAARDECANLARANLLAGVYMNAGSASEAGSVTTYDAVRPFSDNSQRFAHLLQWAVLAKLNARGSGVPDGGVLDDSSMGSTLSASGAAYGHLMLLGPAYPPGGFTAPSEMPGALIEPLFLSDPFEASIAASSHGQELVAQGLAEAVERYFTSS